MHSVTVCCGCCHAFSQQAVLCLRHNTEIYDFLGGRCCFFPFFPSCFPPFFLSCHLLVCMRPSNSQCGVRLEPKHHFRMRPSNGCGRDRPEGVMGGIWGRDGFLIENDEYPIGLIWLDRCCPQKLWHFKLIRWTNATCFLVDRTSSTKDAMSTFEPFPR